MSEATARGWLVASDVEYRYRAWAIALIFFAAFELYGWDHVSAAAGLAGLLTGGGNVHAIETLILWIGAAAMLAAAAVRTWAAAYLQSDVGMIRGCMIHVWLPMGLTGVCAILFTWGRF